jgi:hypothetical protein
MQHLCNMKIVPFKGLLWLLGGARSQLHGKRRLRVLWLLGGGALVMHAKKGGISTSTAETLIVLLQLLVYTFCNFKRNEIHIKYVLQIHLLFLLDFFCFGFEFLYCNHHVGVLFCFQGGFQTVNLSYAIVSSTSIFPPVPISLPVCVYRYFASELVNSCLFEILGFLNLNFILIFLKRWYFGRCIGKSQLCKFVSISSSFHICFKCNTIQKLL